MILPTAPCPKCRAVVVYGQRQCFRCHERFDYGATPPPEPTTEQIRATWAHLQASQQAPQQASQQAPQQPARSPASPPTPPPGHGGHPEHGAAPGQAQPGLAQRPAASASPVAPASPTAASATAVPANAVPASAAPAAAAPERAASAPATMAAFVDRGRFDDETWQAPTSAGEGGLGELFEPTVRDERSVAVVAPAWVEGFEPTSLAASSESPPSAGPSPSAAASPGSALSHAQPCVDCGVALEAGRCPICGVGRPS